MVRPIPARQSRPGQQPTGHVPAGRRHLRHAVGIGFGAAGNLLSPSPFHQDNPSLSCRDDRGGSVSELTWGAISAITAVVGNALAVIIAVLSLRRADQALLQAAEISEQAMRAHYDIEGAAAAIAWRDQVIALHDRGLSPAQIRAIMLLEDGGEGYERSNGRIDDIVAAIPRSAG